MMSVARHSRIYLRIAAAVFCVVFAVSLAPAWAVEGLCKEFCCLAKVSTVKAEPASCCPTVNAETCGTHEHRPMPCPLRWCCEEGEFTPILQGPPSLPQKAGDQHDQQPSALLALDAELEEQQARRFMAEASPPKPPPAVVWLNNSSLLI